MKPYGVELMNYIFGDFYRDTSILICRYMNNAKSE